MGVQVIEGTWEQILEKDSELAGRRVKVIVVDGLEESALRDRAAALVQEAEKLEIKHTALPSGAAESTYGNMIEEKYRKQGFRF